jgi:hypothetical protein
VLQGSGRRAERKNQSSALRRRRRRAVGREGRSGSSHQQAVMRTQGTHLWREIRDGMCAPSACGCEKAVSRGEVTRGGSWLRGAPRVTWLGCWAPSRVRLADTLSLQASEARQRNVFVGRGMTYVQGAATWLRPCLVRSVMFP